MRYKTKITFLTGGKYYEPGMILPKDISSADMVFLKSKGFIEPVDADSFADTDVYDESDIEDESDIFLGFGEKEPEALKSPEEILKLRSKKDVASYATSIGLELGNDYEEKSLKDLQQEVIDFQKESLEGSIEDDF